MSHVKVELLAVMMNRIVQKKVGEKQQSKQHIYFWEILYF